LHIAMSWKGKGKGKGYDDMSWKGKGNGKGNQGYDENADWDWMMHEMMMMMAVKGKGKGKGGKDKSMGMDIGKGKNNGKANGKGKSHGKQPKKNRADAEEKLQKDLEPLKAEVTAYLEERGGYVELSEVASKCPCNKRDLEQAGFKFGPANEAQDIYVFLADSPMLEGDVAAPVPPVRSRRRSELEVLDELLDFMDETDGHAPLRDIHQKFKLKEKPKKRLELLGFTFEDNTVHGGCEVYMPAAAKLGGVKRQAYIDSVASVEFPTIKKARKDAKAEKEAA